MPSWSQIFPLLLGSAVIGAILTKLGEFFLEGLKEALRAKREAKQRNRERVRSIYQSKAVALRAQLSRIKTKLFEVMNLRAEYQSIELHPDEYNELIAWSTEASSVDLWVGGVLDQCFELLSCDPDEIPARSRVVAATYELIAHRIAMLEQASIFGDVMESQEQLKQIGKRRLLQSLDIQRLPEPRGQVVIKAGGSRYPVPRSAVTRELLSDRGLR